MKDNNALLDVLKKEDFFKLIGADKYHANANIIWDCLKINGYTISKAIASHSQEDKGEPTEEEIEKAYEQCGDKFRYKHGIFLSRIECWFAAIEWYKQQPSSGDNKRDGENIKVKVLDNSYTASRFENGEIVEVTEWNQYWWNTDRGIIRKENCQIIESPSSSPLPAIQGEEYKKDDFKNAGELVDLFLGTKDPSDWALRKTMADAIEQYAKLIQQPLSPDVDGLREAISNLDIDLKWSRQIDCTLDAYPKRIKDVVRSAENVVFKAKQALSAQGKGNSQDKINK